MRRKKNEKAPKFVFQIGLTSVADTTSLPPRNLRALRVTPFEGCCVGKDAGEGL